MLGTVFSVSLTVAKAALNERFDYRRFRFFSGRLSGKEL